ncbi:HlyD family type I secretion periplasmic adaptor subunit [Pseudoduganella sp. GCM10020061]|uniref:HlyD family type I secretion periplasmic adaptor subunit n=1 Tax=Pseudoduganella sp. GCM10020061 TaxID=3317345 RepID=UPI003639AEAB
MKLIEKSGLATDVVSHDVTPETVNTNASSYTRLGWIIVLVGFVGFMLWATLAPLDKGVPMSGHVAKESNRKVVQHLVGGTVDEILVREGDRVKAGQVLVRMNSVQAKSQADVSYAQYFAARAAEARLIAERDGLSSVPFPKALEPYRSHPGVIENVGLQSQLFVSRRDALRSELSALEESIQGIKMQIEGTRLSLQSKKEQAEILKEQLTNIRELARDGYVPRARQLDLERALAQLMGSMAEDNGNIGRAQRQVSEMTVRRAQRVQEFQKEVRTQLSDVQREANALEGRMRAEQYILENVEVKAPADGVVMDMEVFTRGGVVGPGFRMMDVVPTADALVVEGQLPINLVDKVHPGLPVDLIFSAFNQSTTPKIDGEVAFVSADRLLDEKSGAPYYKVSVRVTPKGLKKLNDLKLQVRPGMPVELFVKTGERTMMNYLLKPLFDRANSSLSEE